MKKLNEVLKSLIDLNQKELREVIEEAKDRITKLAKQGLNIGDNVTITNENNNNVYRIIKKNKVNWIIQRVTDIATRRIKYNCPPGLLKLAE